MSLLENLSSNTRDRTEESNKQVADRCLADPSLLAEIAAGLESKNPALIGDCAEVFTQVAMTQPEKVAPFGEALVRIRLHKNTRVRWETAHCLALISSFRPDLVAKLFSDLVETIRQDESIIVRDYTIDILANYAASGVQAAREAYPALIESLRVWNGKHAGHALAGLGHVAGMLPELQDEIRAHIQPFLTSEKGVIKKVAKRVSKITG